MVEHLTRYREVRRAQGVWCYHESTNRRRTGSELHQRRVHHRDHALAWVTVYGVECSNLERRGKPLALTL